MTQAIVCLTHHLGWKVEKIFSIIIVSRYYRHSNNSDLNVADRYGPVLSHDAYPERIKKISIFRKV